jgi:hypothetical protein
MSGAPPPLPPPPPRRPPTSSGVSKPHAALKPHESTASIPYLDSAPPSGNFNDADFLQTSQLPPPPPPPPSRRPLSPPRSISSNNTSNTSTSPESTNLSSFPPPPNVTTKSRETEQEQDGPPSYLPFMTFVPKKQLQVLAAHSHSGHCHGKFKYVGMEK